jgi:hypothetical protein
MSGRKKTANFRVRFFRCTKGVLTLHLFRDAFSIACVEGEARGLLTARTGYRESKAQRSRGVGGCRVRGLLIRVLETYPES